MDEPIFLSLRATITCILFLSTSLVSAEQVKVDALIKQANLLNLSGHSIWQKLVSYEQDFMSANSAHSTIHNSNFFYAHNGKTNPTAELTETLRAFFLPVGKDKNQHAICRSPARYLWIKKTLGLTDLLFPTIHCPDFHKWTHNNSIHSISVIFASGFLGNPGSYYGHVLLKLNSSGDKKRSMLLDETVNYGAIVPSNENPLSYMVKGIIGGYEGGFSNISYYFHNRNYGEIELRDLWEYELNLSQDEVDFLVAHAWEILGKKHTYFFFKKNCVTRLAELLEIVEDIKVVPKNPVFVLPQVFIKKLATTSRRGAPFVRSIQFYPSRQSRLYAKFSTLTALEKDIVFDITRDIETLTSDAYTLLSIESKQIVLDTLLDYYQFAKVVDVLSEKRIETYRQKLLIKRFMLPPGEKVIDHPFKESPHEAREPSQLQFGPTYNESFGKGFTITLRPTYYDSLDSDSGFPRNSALTMGEIKLLALDDQIKLRHLDIVKIESVNSAITRLPGDDGDSWKLRLGVYQQNLSCIDCLALRVEADYGQAVRPYSNILFGAFVGGMIQDNRQGSGNLLAKVSLFSNITLTDKLKTRISVEIPKQIDGSGGGEEAFILESRYQLRDNTDIRFFYEKKESTEYSLAFGYYF